MLRSANEPAAVGRLGPNKTPANRMAPIFRSTTPRRRKSNPPLSSLPDRNIPQNAVENNPYGPSPSSAESGDQFNERYGHERKPVSERIPSTEIKTPKRKVAPISATSETRSPRKNSSVVPSAADVLMSPDRRGKDRGKMQQLYIDFGQSDFGRRSICSECGMLYVQGLDEDSQAHKRICRDYRWGVSFGGWKNERVAATFEISNAKGGIGAATANRIVEVSNYHYLCLLVSHGFFVIVEFIAECLDVDE